METLVLDEYVSAALIAERQRLGHDRYDEVHAGRYVISPLPNSTHGYIVMEVGFVFRSLRSDGEIVVDAINVGELDDFRVPDVAITAPGSLGTLWHTDGACRVAVEVLSPGEPSGSKIDHYRAHGVQLYFEIDPEARTVTVVDDNGWHTSGSDAASTVAAALDFTVA